MYFVGAFPNDHQGGVAVIALDGVVFDVAVAAMDAHGFQGDFAADFGCEQLRHTCFEVCAQAVVALSRGFIGKESGGLDLGGHIRQFDGDCLMLCDALAESLALGCVLQGRLERGRGYSDGSSCNVDSAGFERVQHLSVSISFMAAYCVLRGYPYAVEDQLHGVDALVP